MFRILKFLTEYRNLVYWFILQFICLIIIINYNNHQRHEVGDNVLILSRKMQSGRANVKKYFNLDTENEILKEENLVLHQKIEYLKSRLNYTEGILRLDSNKITAFDTSKIQKQLYTYIPCRAINNTTERNYNYITMDKGSDDGVKVGMGVISPRGIAGRVIRVTKDYSLALSMLNLNFKLSAKDSRTGNVGMYEWEGGSSRFGYIKYIPQEVELRIGDTIVTSGYSAVFPEGFIIGVLSDNKDIKGGFYKAKVALSTQFDAIQDLYIVEAKHRGVVDSLTLDLPQ